GIDNTSEVGVCAEGDVLVAAGLDDMGGTAKIKAEAEAAYIADPPPVQDGPTEPTGFTQLDVYIPQAPTSATATTTVVSHNGSVGVIDIQDQRRTATASIEAEAYNSNENNAYVGVAAGADLSPGDIIELDSPPDYEPPTELLTNGYEMSLLEETLEGIPDVDYLPGSVYVIGSGASSKASIISYAYQGPVNTAETVVCAPGEVVVLALNDGFAQIKSRAGSYWGEGNDATNTATTRIYASEVEVDVPTTFGGQGIWASAAGTGSLGDSPNVDTEFLMTEYDGEFGTGEFVWILDNFGDEEPGDDSATLIIQGYESRENCPDCPPCPDCDLPDDEQIGPFVAPLGTAPIPALEEIVFGQGGRFSWQAPLYLLRIASPVKLLQGSRLPLRF
ncbi:MAG: hypothetical protein ACYS3N_24585, partial [Planctomycetota bacterium]